MTGYVRKFECNTTMSFKITDKQLLKKYNQIWKKVKGLLDIKLDSEPAYGDNDKYKKTKIKTYSGSVITNFQGKKLPKEKAACKCLSIIMLDSVIKVILKKVNLMSLIVILRMKQNLMMNLTNNLLKAKKVF